MAPRWCPWRLRWPHATGRATEIIDVRDPDGFGEMLSFSMLDGVRCVLAPAPGGADAPLAVEWADGTVQTLETFESPLPPSEGDLAAAALLSGLPITVVFLLAQRWMISGLAAGGVKG
jgi:hypothetical protein